MRAIFGAEKIYSGDIFISGKKIKINSVRDAMMHKIGFLTEDRRSDGLALSQSVELNINMYSYDLISFLGIVDLKKERKRAIEYQEKMRIKTPNVKQIVNYLSGGNQQKIDVGAKEEIFKLIESLAAQGKGIIIISSYLPEAMGLSDRMVIMAEGHIAGSVEADEVKQMREEDILRVASTIYDEEVAQ